jgi:magnesium transporter
MKSKKRKKQSRAIIRKPGASPGTLVFTGEKIMESSSVKLIQYNEEQLLEHAVYDTLPPASEGAFITWYDIEGLHNVSLVEALGKEYGLHPLVLEDILDTQQRPKFEAYDDAIFITMHAITFYREARQLQLEHVAIYAGANFLLSFQEKDDNTFAPVRERIRVTNGRIRKRGSDYLAYALADSIVDNYFIVLDQLQEVIEALEEEVMYTPNNLTKSKIHQLKLQTIMLRKSMLPTREAINWFVKSDCAIVQPETDIFTRDLYDHIVQVIDMVETYRDILNGLYDLYLSEISYRMNNVMQLLTIISTIFIPLTFLVGVYGMNFENMPELRWRYGYFAVWGLMIGIVVWMLFYFRRRKWL